MRFLAPLAIRSPAVFIETVQKNLVLKRDELQFKDKSKEGAADKSTNNDSLQIAADETLKLVIVL